MKKTILLLTFIFLILTSALIAQNVAETIPGGVREGDKIELQYQSVNLNEGWENILFNNGPLVTNPAVGCNGGDASAITSPNTVFGFAANKATFFYVADDFTSNATWTIDSLKFFSYQTVTGGSGVTINGIFVRIWNGAPNAGGTVVWGDTTTNRLAVTRLTNIYRVTATTLTNCDRRIQEVVAAVNVTLPAGTYWVEWGFTGTATSGPWQPPVTIANQPVTGNALQRNGTTWSALLDGTNAQGVPFIVFGTAGAACPVQPPTNPNPANNATNVSITPGNATWTNGAGTTRVKVFFGPAGNLTQVYNGPAISQIAIPGPLQYSTTYQWRVRCENDTCGVDGPTWSFTTMADPLLVVLINEPFPNMNNWTPVGPLGLTNWSVLASSQAGGTSPELRKSWTPSFNGASYLKSIQLNGPVGIPLQGSFRHFFDWYANPSGTFGLAITYDDGGSYTPLFQVVDPTGNVGPELVNFTFSLTQSAFKLAFFYNGYSFNHDNLFFDDLLVQYIIPVELTSFVASAIGNDVQLSWTTATEMNNRGFEIQRKEGVEYQTIGFISGNGTTVQPQTYSFTDKNLKAGSYTYRLKQIDFNGQFEYSKEIEVDVIGLKEFSLAQNYPNPFNPTTTLSFSLAVDSKVSLKIFDVLGQEIMTLLNETKSAGKHNISFDASTLNSGVYFYRIDATGVDGQKFTDAKKMILNK
jgi:hypothetical protein